MVSMHADIIPRCQVFVNHLGFCFVYREQSRDGRVTGKEVSSSGTDASPVKAKPVCLIIINAQLTCLSLCTVSWFGSPAALAMFTIGLNEVCYFLLKKTQRAFLPRVFYPPNFFLSSLCFFSVIALVCSVTNY